MNNKCVKGFRKIFKKFASETSMHGFKDLSTSTHVSTTIFWVSVLIFAICMVGMHLAETVKDFSEQKTTMMIQPADKNETILYPPFRICYPHWMHWVSFEKAQQLGFTKDAVLYALAYLGEVYTRSNVSLSACQAHKELIQAMAANGYKNLTQFYLSILGEAEWPMFIRSYWRREPSPVLYFDGSASTLCEIADEHKIAALFKGEKLNSEGRNLLDIDNIYNNVFQEVKEVVNEDEYYFYMTDYLKEHLGDAATYSKGNNNVSMSMTFCPLGYADTHTCFKIENSVRKYFVFVSGNVYKWKNKPQSPCLENIDGWISPNDTCTNLCQKYRTSHAMYWKPRPVPMDEVDFLAYRGQENIRVFENEEIVFVEAPECRVENGTESGARANMDQLTAINPVMRKKYETCMKSCQVGCVEYRYSYSIQPENFDSHSVPVSQRVSSIVIQYQQNKDILVMTEEELQTWENFIGNVGGLLGIWTGASILSFIQTIYLCCFISIGGCCKSCYKKRGRYNLQQGIELDNEQGQTINMMPHEDTFEVIVK